MFDKFKKQLLCCKPTRLKYPRLPPNPMSKMKALAASEPQRAVSDSDSSIGIVSIFVNAEHNWTIVLNDGWFQNICCCYFISQYFSMLTLTVFIKYSNKIQLCWYIICKRVYQVLQKETWDICEIHVDHHCICVDKYIRWWSYTK